VSDFADQIAALSPEKRALLARRNPLSFAQERLWFLDRLAPNSAAYIIPTAVRLEGQLDRAVLARSLNAIIARHEVLRTTFPALEGHPVQLVAPVLRLPLPLLDLSDLPTPAREAEADRLMRAEPRHPFDLAGGPLLRACLLRLNAAEHLLLLTLHHIVADGWSIDVLLHELTVLYQAFSTHRPAPLPELPIQYADYAAWQREWLHSEGDELGSPLQTQLAYWSAQLDGAPALLALPTDHPYATMPTFQGATHSFQLSAELSAALQALSQRTGATLFMTLLAAFQTLLYRYSGQDDIVVGTPIANRADADVEGLIGCFVNTLVLRADLSNNPPFDELLRRMRATCLDAYAHQDLPFEQLVAALQPQRTLSHTPLFQVVFLLQHARPAVATSTGLTLRPLLIEPGTAEFDMVLMMQEARPGIGGMLKYRTDLFEAATITRLLRQFQTLLAGIAADPTARIAELPLLGTSERRQLLVEWNATETALPKDAGIAQLFGQQADRTPDAVAVIFENQHLTYRELNVRANQLAHHLRSQGVQADTLVGIYLERSPELFVALLGTLKAGGAYLPLDPSYPSQRLHYMLNDSQARVLITASLQDAATRRHADTATDQLLVSRSPYLGSLVDLVASWPAIARQPTHNPASAVDGDNLAYLIYTSGSTGQPKGAMIVQHALVNYVGALAGLYGLGTTQRMLHFFSVSFDAAAEDIFPPLLSGATVVCPRDPTVWAPSELLDFCERQQIDTLHLPAAYWHALVAWLPDRPGAVPGSLRVVSVGGERIIVDALRRWAARSGPRVQFRNVYGPTETTITSIVYAPPGHDTLLTAGAPIPIGRPIANTKVYLLDRQMQPVPIGVAGELFIGGAGLARGYHQRPDLTAERFVPNPFAATNDEGRTTNDGDSDHAFVRRPSSCVRLYKTGDLARYRPDGAIEFLGRIDHQIKIRGFRIEPAEIEAALMTHPNVREAAVVVREDVPGALRLVAYVVPIADEGRRTKDEGADSSFVSELRAFLATRLPAYMLPAAFVLLAALPLNPNGKLDLRALPDPDGTRPAPQATYVAPQNDVEQRIAAIWQAVLGLDRIGVHDNFFELGGHSLLLIQMHSQLREALNQELSVVELFQYPTINALAQHICEKRPASPAVQQIPDRADPPLDTLPSSSDIAIIGMSGRFPGASNVEAFWENIRDGVESIAHFSEQELLAAGIPPALLQNPHYIGARGAMQDIDRFDAHFFGYLPREAELMDPQQRLFLECAWEALERAGYDSERFARRIGVYAGSSMSSYMLVLYAQQQMIESLGSFEALLGNDKDFLATRVAYKLNLRGPAVTVQTACSTSLVAVHFACQSLLNGECEIALAGGVSIGIYQKAGYIHQEGGIYSPDGHCRAFDAQAQGTVGGSGVGVVVLKRLADALADGDPIQAVIKGFAINNDGSLKMGYTAPSVDGQAEVIREALARAQVAPATIGYIEAHGTATALGDPIEVAALTQVFRSSTDGVDFCAIGSVKTNIGHLDAAAGVAGLIKTVFALKHRQIPPSLHFHAPNPQIDFANTPFYVSTRLAEWPSSSTPRRAGVSSFGIGGTNAHVVLEEAPPLPAPDPARAWHVLPLSAKTTTALAAATANLVVYLHQNPAVNLADVAYTLQIGRRAFEHRQILVCRDRDDALAALASGAAGSGFRAVSGAHERAVAFLFPGGGAQYVNMGRELYSAEPVFRTAIDRCAELLQPQLGVDLRAIIFDESGGSTLYRAAANDASASSFGVRSADGMLLKQTAYALPALFSVEYALAQLLTSWGLVPAAMIGHSVGEYVAACLADVLSLEDALASVVIRGRLFEELPQGSMLSVVAAADAIRPLLGADLSFAAINSPIQCVVSGSVEAVERLSGLLDECDIDYQQIKIDVAAHSQLVEQILPRFVAWMQSLRLRPPRIPFISNVTGTWITDAQATDPAYWGQHLRQTVRFWDGVTNLLQHPNLALLEVGPGRTLTSLIRSQAEATPELTLLSSLPHRHEDQSDEAFLLTTLGRLWLSGVKINWAGLYVHERRQRVQLPTYPFERQRYWLDSQAYPPTDQQPAHVAVLPSQAQPAASMHPRPKLPNEFVAPRDESEQMIALIWQDCLGIGPIGVHDNFFDLGGHSLLATQVVSRIRDAFQLSLPLRRLFDAPTVAGLAQQIDSARLASSSLLPLQPQPRDDHPPLAFAQQRLWFLDQLMPGSPLYNVAAAIQLTGQLDLAALASSLTAVVRRHEALRTTFAMAAGQPVQVIAPALAVPLPLVDLRACPDGLRQATLAQLVDAEARRPFDLEHGPLIRATVLRPAATEQLLLLTLHHIISDGWSQGLLVREIGAFYTAYLHGQPASLPELPIQYADYALWQREWLQGAVLDGQLAYWSRSLAGVPPLLNLPTDRPRPAVQTFAGASLPLALDAALSAELHTLSRQHNTTLFMTLLAAFQVLLARYSHQDDILVGTPISGRTQAATEVLIGCFLNTLVLRSRLAAGVAFAELLEQVRTTCLDAYAHQDLPFEQLVEALHVPRNLSTTPLFQVMFVVQNAPIDPLVLPDLTLQAISVASPTAKFDLALSVVETPGGLAGMWEYNTDLFEPSTITRLSGHFATLLAGILADPGQRVAYLPLLSTSERAQLLVEWNHTAVAYRREQGVHELFAAQVERTPDAVALVAHDGHLTYEVLNARANQLAHYLRQCGVGPEVPVGVCLERSSALVVALLGVFKAGGAYVPLDPAYPQARLRFMRDDARIAVLLTATDRQDTETPRPEDTEIAQHHRSVSRGLLGARTVDLRGDGPQIARQPTTEPAARGLAGSQLAYLIYTSGTTGTPKAVMIEQRQLTDILLTLQTTLDLRASDVLACSASCTFDIFLFQLLAALLVGGRTLLLTSAQVRDPAQFSHLLQHVTILEAVPSLLRQLVAGGMAQPAAAYRALRLVMPGGDLIPPELLHDLAQVFPQAALHPTYGPTESAIMATGYRLPTGAWGVRPLLGRPLDNRTIYILDAQHQLVPIGVVGELYIGGSGVSRGYWQRPELTAARFVPNPFAPPEDERRTTNDEADAQPVVLRPSSFVRLYATGDLGRFRADGVIEFFGRADAQVKVRGFRIELGEIEAVLRQHPAVREAAVLAREDTPGEQRLVAYLVPQPEQAPSITDLRQSLQAQVPEHMLPSAFIFLEALPLTTNGKLDRRLLPAPDAARPALDSSFAAPRTPFERSLAAIWQQVLGIAEVGIHDNFFALGGDSILSIQIIARARQAGLQLSPRQIFEHQTIAGLAAVAELAPLPQPQQGLVTGPLPLTPTQRWFFEQQFPVPQHWNQAVLFTVRGTLNPRHLSRALRAVTDHHDALRLRFSPTQDGWQQDNASHSAATALALDWLDLSALPIPRQALAITQAADDLHTRLDFCRGPLGRVAFFNLGAALPGRLLLILHHLVVDGVSWRVLLEDVQTAYAQLSAGQSITLPPKTSSFHDWAHRLAGYARDAALRAELAYWRAQPWTQLAALPLDHTPPVGANTVASARSVAVALSAAETRALLHAVPPVYRTRIDEVLLSALALALARWTGAQVQQIDIEGHGREPLFDDLDLSRTVGLFTTVAPLLLDLRGALTPGAVLKAIKEQLRRRPHHGIGYGVLRYLSEDATVRDELRALPKAEISFNYLGQLDQVLAGSALLAAAPEASGAAQTPLAPRAYLLDITGTVFEERLHISITYSAALHQHATIAQLADSFSAALRELIAHCQSPEAGGYTPADFPQIALDQPALDDLLTTLTPAGRDQPQIEDIYPLTPMQEGMLFHHLLDPVSGVYFEQTGCMIEGPLDAAAFTQAWTVVIARHAVLRTALVWEGLSEPLQVVYERVEVPLELRDWRALPAPEQARELAAYEAAEQARGFDLRQAPLMRLALLRLGERSYRLLWNHHHVLMDGWCLPVLLKEVLSCYAAFSRGAQVELPASAPYSSYIAWLRRQELPQAEAYWRQVLAGFAEPTPLPLDSGVGRVHAADMQAEGYAEEWVQLPGELSSQLQTFARQQRVTLNTLVVGAWARLLSGYSGAAEVVFGATVSGRPPELPGIEVIIGLFINTLPIRVQLPPQARVTAWLQDLQAQQLELRQYEYSPLVQVQGWSDVPRTQALFESLVVFENYPSEAGLLSQVSGLVIGDIAATERTNYPLTLLAVERDARLVLRLSYQRQRFAAAGLARLLEQLAVVLAGMTVPAQRVGELPLLTEAEREQVLVDWNATAAEYPRDAVVQELFEAQVARRPDAIALVYAGQQLSYAALDRRANQLAHHLRAHGVGPEVCVGIYAERSLELAIGLLAVLKAGGVYLPIDPDYPQERVAFMLGDSRAAVLITAKDEGRRTKDEATQPESLHDLGLVIDDLCASPATIVNRQSEIVHPDNLAYVIYTSGSTGRPKGALIEQRGMINHLYAKIGDLGLAAEDIVAQTASQSFDISIWQFFAALLVGGRVQIYPNAIAFDPTRLLDQVARDRVTVLQTVPSLLRALLETQAAADRARGERIVLRWLVPTGEALPPDLAREWLRVYPEIPLINAYGPTECSDDVTHDVIAAPPGPEVVRMPIGRPVANTQLYILDAHMRLVPIGAAGELYVGGVGVGRGYLGRPDLTAITFVPNPFSDCRLQIVDCRLADSAICNLQSAICNRLYKTGDLARYQPDGTIEFLGRIDHQVKIRGYRIELGEVELALSAHPQVREAAVLARTDAPGGARLVAYVVPIADERRTTNDESAPSSFILRPSSLTSELHAFLAERLPASMIPAAFVPLDALPLTPNGKLDRRALPAPDAAGLEQATGYVAPRTPTEEVVAGIWAEVLGQVRVGRDQNFFELGGHSLLATQVVVRVRQIFAVELRLRELFSAPTVAGMAEAIVHARAEQQDQNELERLLAELDELSEEETQQLLAQDQ
jgi:amino acid adenylation domain-containing protein/non-ribosomal peptide synthase protein (TIGR01720 family)